MSFNRLSYDTCESKVTIKESVGPGLYQMGTPILCNTCYQDNPQIINQRGGVSMNANTDWRFNSGPVDIETDLLNINRPATNCPTGKYEGMNVDASKSSGSCPKCNTILNGEPCKMCNQDLVNMPDCHFPVDNTRLSNPPSTLRGTGWNRFETLCLDPQANIFFPGEYDTSTRLVFRDNFKACVRNPKVNSMHPQDYAEIKEDECAKLNIRAGQDGYGEPLFMKRERCN